MAAAADVRPLAVPQLPDDARDDQGQTDGVAAIEPYTGRFVLAQLTSTLPVDVWFHPGDDRVYILRDIVLTNQSSSPAAVQVWIHTASNQDASLLMQPALAGGTSVHLELRQVIEKGEKIVGYSNGQPWSLAITGYVLSA